MYMSEPLSATISPYFFIARKIFCDRRARAQRGIGPFTLAFSRSRAPIGSAPAV